MIVATLRMVKAWLADGTNGAQAWITAVPRTSGDAVPPTLQAIAEETSDEAVATEDGVPSSLPALGLMLDRVSSLADQTVNDEGDGTIDLVIRYLTKNSNAATATRDAAYSMQGVLKSLRQLFRGGNEASRTLLGVQLINMRSMEALTLYQKVGDGFCSGAIKISLHYRDTL